MDDLEPMILAGRPAFPDDIASINTVDHFMADITDPCPRHFSGNHFGSGSGGMTPKLSQQELCVNFGAIIRLDSSANPFDTLEINYSSPQRFRTRP
jgi:hypothetical protein